MAKLQVEIDLDNAAFDGDARLNELAVIMRRCIDKLLAGNTQGRLFDVNGNTVGSFELSEDE